MLKLTPARSLYQKLFKIFPKTNGQLFSKHFQELWILFLRITIVKSATNLSGSSRSKVFYKKGLLKVFQVFKKDFSTEHFQWLLL